MTLNLFLKNKCLIVNNNLKRMCLSDCSAGSQQNRSSQPKDASVPITPSQAHAYNGDGPWPRVIHPSQNIGVSGVFNEPRQLGYVQF
jgi:hypothetical protein